MPRPRKRELIARCRYKQASASQVSKASRLNPSSFTTTKLTNPFPQKYAAANASNPTAANTLSSSGLTLDEACRILNVAPPRAGAADVAKVHEQFKRLFDMNDPKKGGSFYLQSKVLRARERLELEVREAEAAAQREEELRQGWRPKLYRD